jgi:hypothetical protein
MIAMFDNFLPKALFISLAIHTAFICTSLIHLPQVKEQRAPAHQIEIDYRAPASKRLADVRQRAVKPAQQLDLKNTAISSNGSVPLKLGKESGLNNFMVEGRRPDQIRSTEMSRRVSIVPIKSEKINNPAYVAYNEVVRHKIEEKVYDNYRYHRMEAGLVYLTFIVGADGNLRAVQVIEDKSNASANLKEISLTSLKQARFPPFQKGMTLPEYTFNIEIQYQVKD